MKNTQIINKIHRSGSCIYCIQNINNKKVYIGQTTNITYRKNAHLQQLKKGTHPNEDMQNDFNARNEFVLKALEFFPPWVPKSILNGKEYAYIEKYKANTTGYNVAAVPIGKIDCKATPDKYNLCASKIESVISSINENGGMTFLRIHDLCKVLNCQPKDILE